MLRTRPSFEKTMPTVILYIGTIDIPSMMIRDKVINVLDVSTNE